MNAIQLRVPTATETPAGKAMPYLPCLLSLAHTMNPVATVARTTTTSESMKTP
ncbi:hypothetical protein D3C85_1847320 [compost metagenome]